MKQNLLKSFMTMLLLGGVYVMTMAQTTIYGMSNNPMGVELASFNLDEINTDAATAATALQDVGDYVYDIYAGTSLDNKYYGIYDDEDYNTCFGTLNFTTGEIVLIKKFSYVWGETFMDITSYDGKLYGLLSKKEEVDDGIANKAQIVEIDPGTGSYTVLKSFDDTDAMYDALASDGNGGFYWVHNVSIKKDGDYAAKYYPSLYHIDASYNLTTVIDNQDVNVGYGNYRNSLVTLADGNVLYIQGKKVYLFDVTAKTVTEKGALSYEIDGLSLTMSSENGTPGSEDPGTETKNMRKLVSHTRYGDILGTTSDATLVTNYFYDSDMKLLRETENGRQNSQFDYDLTYYTKYNYDDAGNLLSEVQYQYGLYDLGDMASTERSRTEYAYNDNNQKTSCSVYYSGSTTPYRTTYYTYDDDGNLYTEYYTTNYGTTTTMYEEYVNGLSTYVTTTTPWGGTMEVRSYDDNGNPLYFQSYDLDPETGYPDWMGTVTNKVWTYDESGFCTNYTEYYGFDEATGEPVPTKKTDYEAVDGNTDKVKSVNYTYGDGEWVKSSSTYYVDEYRDFSDMAESTACEVSVTPSEEKLNTVALNITMPMISYTNPCVISVYRDGECIKTDNVMNYEIDAFAGTISYTDEMVANGDHDYYVQVGVAPYSDILSVDDIDEPSVDEPATEETEYTFYCISNVAEQSFDTELPAVTDLKVSNATKTIYTDPQSGGSGECFETELSWTNPENSADYGFISNSIYTVGYSMSEVDTDDVNATSATFNVMSSIDVYVVTRYQLGKAYSDTISLNYNDLENLTAIEKVTHSGVGVKVANKVLTMDGVANVSVFSIGGQMAAKANNVSMLDMSSLSNGTYVIAIEKNGKLSTYKVILK